MSFVTPGNPAENECARQHIVSTIGKGLFQRHQSEIKMICKKMESEEYRWDIRGEKAADEVSERMIVVCDEGEWGRARMLPGHVLDCKR